MTATTSKLTKLDTGLYASPSGRWHVVKDGYEAVRDDEGRYTTRWDGIELAPSEVCWVVFDVKTDTNEIIVDTLREARTFISRLEAK